MPATSDLVRRFRAATQMSAFANGQIFQFTLTNTSQVLPALVECVKVNTGMATARAVVPKNPSPPAVPPTPVVGSICNPSGEDLQY